VKKLKGLLRRRSKAEAIPEPEAKVVPRQVIHGEAMVSWDASTPTVEYFCVVEGDPAGERMLTTTNRSCDAIVMDGRAAREIVRPGTNPRLVASRLAKGIKHRFNPERDKLRLITATPHGGF